MNRTPRSTSRRAEQALAAEHARHFAVEAVELERFFGFIGQVDRLGSRALHFVGELVAGDARGESFVSAAAIEVLVVVLLQRVEQIALGSVGEISRRGKVEDRLAHRSQ